MIRWIVVLGRNTYDGLVAAFAWLMLIAWMVLLPAMYAYSPDPWAAAGILLLYGVFTALVLFLMKRSSRPLESVESTAARVRERLVSLRWVGCVGAILIVALLAYAWQYEGPGSGPLSTGMRFVVKQGLAEATVFIDGERIGTTPLELSELRVASLRERYAITEGWPPPQAILRYSQTTGDTIEEVATYDPFHPGDPPDSVLYYRKENASGSKAWALTYRVETPTGRVMSRVHRGRMGASDQVLLFR